MIKRCPHCATRPLALDAGACWYCGKPYLARRQPRAEASPVRRIKTIERREPAIAPPRPSTR